MIRNLAHIPPAHLQMPADTVVTLAVRDGYDVLMAVAAGVFASVFLVLLAAILFVFFQIHRGIKAASRARELIAADPAVESLRKTAANVEAISDVLRGEVSELSRSVGRLSDRLTQASDRMEERIEDFNALMEVMQGEAERAFVDTAATARGVRRGIGALHEDGRKGRGSRGGHPLDRRSPSLESGDAGTGAAPDTAPGSVSPALDPALGDPPPTTGRPSPHAHPLTEPER